MPILPAPTLPELHHLLITANHILHNQAVVDAYGHISARDPTNPSQFILSASLPPAAVADPTDLLIYSVATGEPLPPRNPDTPPKKSYAERYIHASIYARYPHVMSVIHSHSPNVLPFATGAAPLRAAFHIAGFIGNKAPVFDIMDVYDGRDGERRDMLVNTQRLGDALAEHFDCIDESLAYGAGIDRRSGHHEDEDDGDKQRNLPREKVVVMHSHGFTTWGRSVQEAVFRAVYTHVNAEVQYKSMLLFTATARGSEKDPESQVLHQRPPLRYLDDDQVAGPTGMGEDSFLRPWELWVREVEAVPLYQNHASIAPRIGH